MFGKRAKPNRTGKRYTMDHLNNIIADSQTLSAVRIPLAIEKEEHHSGKVR